MGSSFLGDFHIHSDFSDGKLTIPQLVDLYGTRGFGAISITDHICERGSMIGKAAHITGRTLTPGTFPLYREILLSEAERAWELYRMVLIPGFELTKVSVSNYRSAHLLGLGIREFTTADTDAIAMARAIRAQGGLAIAAHPVSTRKLEKQTYYLWDRRQELAAELDAWEVASGPYLFDEVAESGLPMIANSDLHDPRQMTSWKTEFDCERHPEAILDAIRKQELRFYFYDEEALCKNSIPSSGFSDSPSGL
jgi:predicted metal-dependent phosphoesterase TrpH